MELFVINRYTGDEQKEETPNEAELREDFLKKIKERKRKSQITNEDTEGNVKLKKRKKSASSERKPLTQNEVDENNITFQEENSEIIKKKKKKKKSRANEYESDLQPDSSNNLSDISPEVSKLKKKKNKKPSENGPYPVKPENKEKIIENSEIENNEVKEPGFTILGDNYMFKKEKIKMKLPEWLANPSVVSVDLKNLTCTVDSIPELDEIFVNLLKKNGISHFFPVQSQIIPWLLQNANRPYYYWPNDICVSAPTGSGKTLAFVLPILQILNKRIVPRIRALVVLPVQDLANQVYSVFETYSKVTNLKVLLLTKKRPFLEEQSLICKKDIMGHYKTVVDIIVTTPGRLVDHLMKTEGLCLSELTYLVIDEADRVMENIQNDWLYHLNKTVNSECTKSYQVPIISYNNMLNKKKPPNKLLFSATLSQDPEKLQQLGLFQPKLFTSVVKTQNNKRNGIVDSSKFIGKYTTPAELKEYYTNCTKANKPLIVHHLLKSRNWKGVLCFVNSAEATLRLARVLKSLSEKALKIGKLSSELTPKKRFLVLKKFSEGQIDVLVSSDALARGIDIPNVQYVISYDSPKFVKTYIHRIGRTGRAGKEGTSVILLTSKEVNRFQKIIEVAGKQSIEELSIDPEELVVYEDKYEEALASLGTYLSEKKRKTLMKIRKKIKFMAKLRKPNFIKTGKKLSKKPTPKKIKKLVDQETDHNSNESKVKTEKEKNKSP